MTIEVAKALNVKSWKQEDLLHFTGYPLLEHKDDSITDGNAKKKMK